MRDDRNLPVRRPVPAKRQRLGFLPTMALWNDQEMQRLLFPIILAVSVPAGALMLYAERAFDLSTWLVMSVAILYPYLIMGLVERHIRRMPRRAPPAIQRIGPANRASGRPLHHGVSLLFCAMGASIAALLALGAAKVAILVTLVLGAVGLLGLVLHDRRTMARLEAGPRPASTLPVAPPRRLSSGEPPGDTDP